MSVASPVPSMGQFILTNLLLYSVQSIIAQAAYRLSEEKSPETNNQQKMGLISILDGLIQIVLRVVLIYFLKMPDVVSTCPASPLKVSCVIAGNFLSIGLFTRLGSDQWSFNAYLRSISCIVFSKGLVNIAAALGTTVASRWVKV